jgi:hypothetical protein
VAPRSHILLVEDDGAVRGAIDGPPAAAGLHVHAVGSGEEALALLEGVAGGPHPGCSPRPGPRAVGADKLKLTYRGLELVDLQVGADYRITPKLSAGPFASYAAGRYGHLKVESPLGNSDGAVPSPTSHTWLTFGLRGTWDF